MPADETLPEGTDKIITEDGVVDDDVSDLDRDGDELLAADVAKPVVAVGTSPSFAAADLRGAFFESIGRVRDQAGDKARDFVQSGKDRATSALDDVVQSIEDAAAEIDAKIGTQYGDYARRAAEGVVGFSDAIKAKDVDSLFDDARDLLSRSPGVAIGIATAVGFVVARLARAGIAEAGASDAGGKAA